MNYFKFRYNLEDYFNTAYPTSKRQENRQIYSAATSNQPKDNRKKRAKNDKLFTRDPNKYTSNIPTLLINPGLSKSAERRKLASSKSLLRPTSCIQKIGSVPDLSANSKEKAFKQRLPFDRNEGLQRTESEDMRIISQLPSPKERQERVRLITALPEEDDDDRMNQKDQQLRSQRVHTEPYVKESLMNATEEDRGGGINLYEKNLLKNKFYFNEMNKMIRVQTAKPSNSSSTLFLQPSKEKERATSFKISQSEQSIATKTITEIKTKPFTNYSLDRNFQIDLGDEKFSSKKRLSTRDDATTNEGLHSISEKLKALCDRAEYTASQNKKLKGTLKRQKRKLVKDSMKLKREIKGDQSYKFWKENEEFLDGKVKLDEEKRSSLIEDEETKRKNREEMILLVKKHRNNFLKRGNSKENLKSMDDPDKKLSKMNLIEARYLYVYKSNLEEKLKEGVYEEVIRKKQEKALEIQRKKTEATEESLIIDEAKQRVVKIKEFERQLKKEEDDAKKFKIYQSVMKHAMKNSFLFKSSDREKYFGTSKLYRGGARKSDLMDFNKSSWNKVMEASNQTFSAQQKKLDAVFRSPRAGVSKLPEKLDKIEKPAEKAEKIQKT
jgi:hypothetical protein